MGWLRWSFLAGASAALLFAASAASARSANSVTCGQIITTPNVVITLTSDLICTTLPPQGNGIEVWVDNVTINLNGHSIVGPGAGAGGGSPTTGAGVLVLGYFGS